MLAVAAVTEGKTPDPAARRPSHIRPGHLA